MRNSWNSRTLITLRTCRSERGPGTLPCVRLAVWTTPARNATSTRKMKEGGFRTDAAGARDAQQGLIDPAPARRKWRRPKPRRSRGGTSPGGEFSDAKDPLVGWDGEGWDEFANEAW